MLDPDAIDGLRTHLSAADLAERLRGVVDTLDAAVDDLGTALRIDDVAAVGRAARRLSLSARIVGAVELAEAAGALEVDAGGVPRLTRNARRDQATVAMAAWRRSRHAMLNEIRHAEADAQSNS